MIVLDRATAAQLAEVLAVQAELYRRRGRRMPSGLYDLLRACYADNIGPVGASAGQRLPPGAEVGKTGPAVGQKEAAELLRVSVRTVRRLTAAGELTPRRIGQRVLYRRDQIEEYIRADQQ